MKFIGVEISAEYADMAKRRVMRPLFTRSQYSAVLWTGHAGRVRAGEVRLRFVVAEASEIHLCTRIGNPECRSLNYLYPPDMKLAFRRLGSC